MSVLSDVLAARAQLHLSTYWPAALRVKGSNHLWQTDVYLASAVAQLQPTPPPPPPAFTKTLQQGGSLDSFLDSLVPGDVAGIAPGVYPVSSYHRSQTGAAAKPIIVTSTDTSRPAIIGDGKTGRLALFDTAAYWTFRYLGMDGRTPDGSSWTLGGTNITFDQCDMSNFDTNIGVMGIAGTGVTISRSRIHDCGTPGNNMEHGIYNEGDYMHVVDCLIYRCAARGIQCRGGHGDLYEYVTISDCGEGIIFGDDRGAVNSTITKSILVNQNVSGRYLVEALGSANSGNVVDDNFIYNAKGWATIQPGLSGLGVTVTNVKAQNPMLDGNLMPQLAAAQGYGCRVIPPKILVNA